MKAYYKNDLKHAYLILEGVESTDEDYQIYMLKENDIPGLLPTDIRYVDSTSQYYYDISGKVSLKAVHEKAKLSYEEMKRIVLALLKTIKTIRKYMLEPNCLLLNPEYIFCEKEQIFFCYYPQCSSELKEAFHQLTEYFVSEVEYQEQEGVHFAYRMHKATMEENYSIEQIMRELMEEKQPPIRYEEKMEKETKENEMIQEPTKRFWGKWKSGKWGSWDEIHIEEDDL